MQNDLQLHHFGKLKMYAHQCVPTKVSTDVMELWMELTRSDLTFIENGAPNDSLKHSAADSRDDMPKLKTYWVMCAKKAKWTYVVYFDVTPVAFMTVDEPNVVSALFVREDCRGLGIASYLIRNHMEIFKDRLKLTVVNFNLNALRLYLKLGFVLEQEGPIYTTMYHNNF